MQKSKTLKLKKIGLFSWYLKIYYNKSNVFYIKNQNWEKERWKLEVRNFVQANLFGVV